MKKVEVSDFWVVIVLLFCMMVSHCNTNDKLDELIEIQKNMNHENNKTQ